MGLHESSELLSGLAPFELEFFQQNGFVFRERFTTDDEVAALREIYDHLFAVRAGWDEGQQFDLGGNEADGRLHLPQLLSPSSYAPELRETTYLAHARQIAAQVLGEDLQEGYGEHMIYKPAGYGAATPWHQDQAWPSFCTRLSMPPSRFS